AFIAGQAGLGGSAERFAGGADRLVGLLGVLDLARIHAGLFRQILAAIELVDLSPGSRYRRLGQSRGVGAHIGDETALVQTLRHLHGAGGAETEFAARLLLHRRRAERRIRAARIGLGLDLADREPAVAQGGDQALGQ